jgi:imidazolonepropionase-like amidohydrolase
MKVMAHAHSKKAIERSLELGVDSIEHGTFGDAETYKLFKKHNAYLVPTMAIRSLTSPSCSGCAS